MIAMLLVNTAVVALAVLIHYEFLRRLTAMLPAMRIRHRTRIVIGVVGALVAHTLEVWLFALAYWFMHRLEGWGTLGGAFDGSLFDCGYFSFTVFSTLGFGDIVPAGNLRYLTGIESLTGLVLITWSASFLFVEMQRHWTTN